MITAEIILRKISENSVLLAEPQDEIDVFAGIYEILLYLQHTIGSPISSNQFLFIKRYVERSTYSGVGYRFVNLSFRNAEQFGYDKRLKSFKKENFDISGLYYFVKNYQSGRYQSWSPDIYGLADEWRRQYRWVEEGVPCVFYSPNIYGIDLDWTVRWAHRFALAMRKKPAETYYDRYPSMSYWIHGTELLLKDFGKNREVLAPMPSTIEFVGTIQKTGKIVPGVV
jgi:hypothetical protein